MSIRIPKIELKWDEQKMIEYFKKTNKWNEETGSAGQDANIPEPLAVGQTKQASLHETKTLSLSVEKKRKCKITVNPEAIVSLALYIVRPNDKSGVRDWWNFNSSW